MAEIETNQRNPKLCHCGNPAREGQRNCHVCHAEAQRKYRERQKLRMKRLEAAVLALVGT